MFVLRAKCKLTDASADWQLFGLAGPSGLAFIGNSAPHEVWGKAQVAAADIVRLPDAAGASRFLLAVPSHTPALPLSLMDPNAWRWSDVASGVAMVEAATVDQFVPQMLNYELLGGVDFKKGCYPGQEVVARSQYRGTIKRRTFLFESKVPAQAGQEVFHTDDPAQPAGLVANAATTPDGASVLVELKLSALNNGALHLGSADGPLLSQAALPYVVPTDAA